MALFALAVQFVLSFGHVHLDSFHRDSLGVTVAGAPAPISQPSPAGHPAGDGDDYCAVCATLYLAANSFLPSVPQLPVPFVSHPVERFDRVAVIFIAPQRTGFQSRAPPLA